MIVIIEDEIRDLDLGTNINTKKEDMIDMMMKTEKIDQENTIEIEDSTKIEERGETMQKKILISTKEEKFKRSGGMIGRELIRWKTI